LSNIYLDRLDTFVEQTLLPEYNRGDRRRRNRAYEVVDDQIAKARRHSDRAAVRELIQRRRRLPSQDPNDPDYRRLRYVRYCDDWLLGLAGPRHKAEQIKTRIGTFLRNQLKLELSESKTLITHAASQAARFLGYEIRTQLTETKLTKGGDLGATRLTWTRKREGTTAWRESAERYEDTEGVAVRGPRDMAKARLLEAQTSAMEGTSPDTVSDVGAAGIGRLCFFVSTLPAGERQATSSFKGTDGPPTSRSIRPAQGEFGMAYRARAPWPRSVRSSRRSHDRPGSPEAGAQGEGTQVSTDRQER
jgi:hypothetical protein